MPLADGARELRSAENLACRLDWIVTDLAGLVVVAERPRAERDLQPIDLAPDPVECIVGAPLARRTRPRRRGPQVFPAAVHLGLAGGCGVSRPCP